MTWRNENKDVGRSKEFWRSGREGVSKRGEEQKKDSWRRQNSPWGKRIFSLFVFGVIFLFFSVIVTFFWLSRDLPDPNKLIERDVAQSTKIYDRTGETVLYEIHGDQKRTMVSFGDIPAYVKQATIAIEDKDFYKHGGISFWGVFRGTVLQKIRGKRMQGGSTLTQQFIKNAILTDERTVTRKFKEWILAYKLEKKYSKDEILRMYFNEIPYGSTAYGVESASQMYFGKKVKDVSLAEAAILASLPQGPSKYSPYGSNKDLLIGRQHYILDLMVEQGYISREEAEFAKSAKLDFKKPSANILAPHFVMYVKELLADKYGEKMVEQGGLKIYTTLDLNKQRLAEDVIKNKVEKNEKNYKNSNAALVVMYPKTGQILAMVGSRDYFDEKIDGQFNVTTSLRQPGSSIKPLVYVAAFSKGYTPNTVLYDVVTNFSNKEGQSYEPHNYDGAEHGPVTMRSALAGSLNVPAVKTLYLAGVNQVLKLAGELGYSSLKDKDRFGLSLVLGGGEVVMLEHVNAYGAFAREGIAHPAASILKVEDARGQILEEFKLKEKKVLEAKVVRMLNNVLSDNAARSYIFGANNWLNLGNRPVAAKSGTTNDYHDAWTIGYTPSLVAGVWVGNNDNSEMKKGADGGIVAAPIWQEFMKKALGDTPIESFKDIGDIKTGKPVLDGDTLGRKKVKIDRASGLLATEYTPASFIEEKEYSENHCILYYLDKDNPLGDQPKDPSKDPQFNLWESRVLAWAEKQGLSSSTPPTESDNLHIPENFPTVKISNLENKQFIDNPVLSVLVEASAKRGVNRVEYYINNNLLAVSRSAPFSLEKRVDFLSNGYYNLRVRACDDIDNCAEDSLEFNFALALNNTNQSPVGAAWLYPSSGASLTKADFPLGLKFKVSNHQRVAGVKIFAKNEKNEETLLKTVEPIEGEVFETYWNQAPVTGKYNLILRLNTWDADSTESGALLINVKNDPEKTDSSAPVSSDSKKSEKKKP